MGYTLSRATAQKVLRIIGARDFTPVPVGPRLSGGGPVDDPHLVVQVQTVQSNPVQPASAWTLDGRVVPGTVVAGTRVYAMAMADNDGPYTVVGNGRCIAHRVRGLAGEIREGL